MTARQLSRLWRRIRGVYAAGGYDVTVKHWWSRRERRSARLAAKVIEHEAPAIDAEVRRWITNRMLYGYDVIGPAGELLDPRDITADPPR